MLAKTWTATFKGIDALPIEVQVEVSNGLPTFIIVGLPDKAVAESRERIRSTLNTLGLSFPSKRIVVNLSPADVQKNGSHYDLPIAIALLEALNVLQGHETDNILSLGELSLDGSIRPTNGIISAALKAGELGKTFVCPYDNAEEAAWVGSIEVLYPKHLLDLLNHLKGFQVLPSLPDPLPLKPSPSTLDIEDVKGQENAKRALEIAAAGGHHILLFGPPGTGKSMLAKRMSTLLPPPNSQEILEISQIYSISGLLGEGGLIAHRPFRDPHHSATLPAMVGGGNKTKPGEISLAHGGVLFLDELPEFSAATLEALRQPLENQEILISRANENIRFPANFQLIAAMNPCHCGYLLNEEKACKQAPLCGLKYQKKISGPLLDRIDLFVTVEDISIKDLKKESTYDNSATIREKVTQTHKLQFERNKVFKKTKNHILSAQEVESLMHFTSKAQSLLEHAVEQYHFSLRSYYKVLKVARTIADLECSESTQDLHLAEALSYRLHPFE